MGKLDWDDETIDSSLDEYGPNGELMSDVPARNLYGFKSPLSTEYQAPDDGVIDGSNVHRSFTYAGVFIMTGLSGADQLQFCSTVLTQVLISYILFRTFHKDERILEQPIKAIQCLALHN
jgi:hypothetical protein